MPTRYLKESICTSENLILLSAAAERFFYRLIVNVDDFGRMDARPQVLRAKCFTMMEERVSFADIETWLEELRNAQLIVRYTGGGRPYLEISTFTEHNKPRAEKSKCPNPPAPGAPLPETVGNCIQPPAIANDPLQITSYSYSESKSKAESKSETPPPPSDPSATQGRNLARKLAALNAKLSPALRTPLANTLLDITGKRALADAGDDGLLYGAHEAAQRLYAMGYKTDAELLAIEEAWLQDWRGKSGGGTFKQFEEFASERKARKNGHAAPTDPAARTVVAAPTADAFAALR